MKPWLVIEGGWPSLVAGKGQPSALAGSQPLGEKKLKKGKKEKKS